MKNRILPADRTCLVVIDIQEAFRKSIQDLDAVIEKTVTAVKGFTTLDLPVVITEQYPRGLGHTVTEIKEIADKADYFEKSCFSACADESFVEQLQSAGMRHILVAGIETHVCVNQTVHDLLELGFHVHILEDAVTSRNVSDHQTALKKMYLSGAIPSTVEISLFELLVDSKSSKFKEIQSLIK